MSSMQLAVIIRDQRTSQKKYHKEPFTHLSMEMSSLDFRFSEMLSFPRLTAWVSQVTDTLIINSLIRMTIILA